MAVGANGEPRLLLPLARDDIPVPFDVGTSLSVSVSSFQYSGQYLRFLDIICLHPELESVFGEVVDEILARSRP